jgi:hypothetical protein
MQSEKGDSYWTLKSEILTLEDFELPDGRYIGATIEFSGIWEDDAFDYEYGSICGTHREDPYFTIEKWWVTGVWDMATKTAIPMDDVIQIAIDKEMDIIANSVATEVEFPEPDYE